MRGTACACLAAAVLAACLLVSCCGVLRVSLGCVGCGALFALPLASLSWVGRMSGQMPASDGFPSRRGVFGRRLDCRSVHRLGSLVPVYACALRSRPDGRAVGTCVDGYPWTLVSLARGAWVCACVCVVGRALLCVLAARCACWSLVCAAFMSPPGSFSGSSGHEGPCLCVCVGRSVPVPAPCFPPATAAPAAASGRTTSSRWPRRKRRKGRERRGSTPIWSVVETLWLFPLFVFGSCSVGGGLICSADCSLSLFVSLLSVLLIETGDRPSEWILLRVEAVGVDSPSVVAVGVDSPSVTLWTVVLWFARRCSRPVVGSRRQV